MSWTFINLALAVAAFITLLVARVAARATRREVEHLLAKSDELLESDAPHVPTSTPTAPVDERTTDRESVIDIAVSGVDARRVGGLVAESMTQLGLVVRNTEHDRLDLDDANGATVSVVRTAGTLTVSLSGVARERAVEAISEGMASRGFVADRADDARARHRRGPVTVLMRWDD